MIVKIPSTVKKIGEMAFANALMSSITIPSSVSSIGASAFKNYPVTIKIMNPDCVIVGSDETLGEPSHSTVYGYSGSTAEEYARAHGCTFKSLGAAPGQAKKNGKLTENGKVYYYVNGVKQKGLQTVNGKKYYFSAADGHRMTGLINVGSGKICYFSAKDGHMLTGLVNVGGGKIC